jgi:hypothetical protein
MPTTVQEVNRLIELLDSEGKNSIHDGFHSFRELYEHRCILFVTLCRSIHMPQMRSVGNPSDNKSVWRSKKHSDGSEWSGWFILGIGTIPGNQITYHLPEKMWDMTSFVPVLEKAPTFDGHTYQDVINRLQKLFF